MEEEEESERGRGAMDDWGCFVYSLDHSRRRRQEALPRRGRRHGRGVRGIARIAPQLPCEGRGVRRRTETGCLLIRRRRLENRETGDRDGMKKHRTGRFPSGPIEQQARARESRSGRSNGTAVNKTCAYQKRPSQIRGRSAQRASQGRCDAGQPVAKTTGRGAARKKARSKRECEGKGKKKDPRRLICDGGGVGGRVWLTPVFPARRRD